MAKFHKRAIQLYVALQNSEGNSVIKSTAETTGTITTSTAANTIVGVGTKFQYGTTPGDGLGELAVGAYIYNGAGTLVGRIATITSQTAATFEANGAVVISGADFSVGLGPKNAIAALTLSAPFVSRTTESFTYSGNELDRDELNVVTDTMATFDFETLMPSLGTIAGTDPVLSEVPYPELWQAANMAVVLSTGSAGKVTFTNSVASNSFLTVQLRESSADVATQKTYTLKDVRGGLDLDMSIPSKARIKWSFMGNYVSQADTTAIVPDYGLQKSDIAPNITSSTVVSSQLSTYTGSTEPTYVNGTKTLCFQKVSASGINGFERTRFQTSCLDGWDNGAAATDVTVSILEDRAAATFNPDTNIELYHGMYFDWGPATGAKVGVYFHKVQLVDVTKAEIANFISQELKFRNTGSFDIVLS